MTELIKQTEQNNLAMVEGLDEFETERNEFQTIKLKPSRIKLGQQMSQFVKDGLALGGHFFSEEEMINYGPEIEIAVIDMQEGATLIADKELVKKYDEAEKDKLLCYTMDLKTNVNGIPCSQCPYDSYWQDWNNGEPPKCKKFLNFIVVLIKDGEIDHLPKVLTARKTSFKIGQDLGRMVLSHPKGIKFLCSYKITSEPSGDAGYFKLKLGGRRSLANEELAQIIPIARELKKIKELRNKKEKHDEEMPV